MSSINRVSANNREKRKRVPVGFIHKKSLFIRSWRAMANREITSFPDTTDY